MWRDNARLYGELYNGGSNSTACTNTDMTSTSLLIGSGSAIVGQQELNADIAEILIYKTTLSDADRATVKTYLRDRWLPVSTGALPVTNGLTLMLAADIGVTTSGTGVATLWRDQTGLEHNAQQTTASKRPLLVADQLRHKPVLRFDGVDDVMTIAAKSTTLITTNGYTMFAVFNPRSIKTDVANAWENASVFMDWGNQTWGIPVRNKAGVPTFYACTYVSPPGNEITVAVTNGFSTNRFFIGSVWRDAAKIYGKLYGGGSNSATCTDPTETTSTSLLIGAGNGTTGQELNADIAEILIYIQALSGAQRDLVESYLFNKWLAPPRGTVITVR